jgi:hypothetical protein
LADTSVPQKSSVLDPRTAFSYAYNINKYEWDSHSSEWAFPKYTAVTRSDVIYVYKMVFLVGWLDLLTPYTFTQFGSTGNYSDIAILYTLQFTAAHALGFSAFISRILATDLSQSHFSFKLTHEVFLAQSNSFLAIILQLPIPNTWLDYSRLLFYTPSAMFLLLLSCRTLLITTLHEPHGKTLSSIIKNEC